MTDIVQRLRQLYGEFSDTYVGDDVVEAADEIERLRTVIDTAHVHLLRGEGLQAINTLESPC